MANPTSSWSSVKSKESLLAGCTGEGGGEAVLMSSLMRRTTPRLCGGTGETLCRCAGGCSCSRKCLLTSPQWR